MSLEKMDGSKNEKIIIILIDNSIDTTGASKSVLNIIEELKSKQVQFIFICPSGSRMTKVVKNNGFICYELPIKEIRKSFVSLLIYFPYLFYNAYKLSRISKREGASIIHMNDLYNMVGICSKFFHEIKVVTHLRRMPESFPLFFYKLWNFLNVNFSDKLIAVSQANKDVLPANNKTIVVYDPLPEDEKYNIYKPRPLLQKKVSILYLANYNYGKGHSYAIELIKRAVNELNDWEITLNFYGGDFGLKKNKEMREELEQTVQSANLNANISFHGKIDDIEKAMKDHDIVFNLSDSESFSRVTFEALYFGIPTIATDVGGTNEMILDKQTGLLAPPKNVDAMYLAFQELLLNDKLRNEISPKAYNYVRKSFNKSKSTEQILSVYTSLLS